jgi:hypothetical protein
MLKSQKQLSLPKQGDFVRAVKPDVPYKTPYGVFQKDMTFEGIVSSVLFDKNIELSYTDPSDKPVSVWLSLDELSDLEVL